MVFHYYSLSNHLLCAVSVFYFLTTFNEPLSALDNIGWRELAKVHVSFRRHFVCVGWLVQCLVYIMDGKKH